MRIKNLILIFIVLLFVKITLAQEMETTTSSNETQPPEECKHNLAEVCSNQDDCKGCYNYEAFCLKCPIDTQVIIQTDSDPHYAELTNDTHFVTKSSDKNYCAYKAVGTRKCTGNWNGDEYSIIPIYETTDSSVYSELTKDVLDKWKNLILRNISENYFRSHIDVINIEPQIENNVLGIGIQYVFKYDWAATNNTEREIIYVKQLSDGRWIWLTDDEITRRFDESRQSLHNMIFSDGSIGYTKATEYEISSIVPREEVVSKIKECHQDIELEEITIGSKNNTIGFAAGGKVSLNTERCELSPENTFTVIGGTVDLITGSLNCSSYEAACVVYSPGEKGSIITRAFGLPDIMIYFIIGILVIIILFVFLKRRKT